MIHRSFLLKSFQSPLYLFTRNTCVSAAMTILREHEELSASGNGCFPIWLHSAFCVTATVVLCLNVLHDQVALDQRSIEQQLELVRRARGRLESQRCDVMAKRGVHLIDAMLAEKQALAARPSDTHLPGVLSFDGITSRFFELEEEDVKSPVVEGEEPVSFSTEGIAPGIVPEDFDLWFDSMFRQ